PANHPRRQDLIGILNRLIDAIEKQQDPKTGLWYDVMNYNGPGKEKNYFEASASCQYVYATAKGVRLGYLPANKIAIAKRAWKGIQNQFVKEEKGQTNLHGTVKVSGLGGKPYRDGSFEYYMSEPVIVNDPKGLGAFLLAAGEMDLLSTHNQAKGKTVMLDRYYNSEIRKDITGKSGYWHYVWDERNHPGFHFLGHIFRKYGAELSTLDDAPTREKLAMASVYIIVDPDHRKDNPHPNYMTDSNAEIIADWVKAGGVLLMMANDSSNCDLEHFNKLASKFSFRFNNLNINMVKNDHYPTGEVLPGKSNPVFKTTQKMFLKEICGIDLSAPAKPVVQKDGNVLMSITRYGKGTVFAVGDPWLYNEYVDGRRLPSAFENYKAAEDLAKWLLERSKQPVP
nr:glycoside hydrolase family 88 protein [Chitinophagaceae bacterium]